jgi:hypothetical protein
MSGVPVCKMHLRAYIWVDGTVVCIWGVHGALTFLKFVQV